MEKSRAMADVLVHSPRIIRIVIIINIQIFLIRMGASTRRQQCQPTSRSRSAMSGVQAHSVTAETEEVKMIKV